jgi:LCP family protein required for cell wall assembly
MRKAILYVLTTAVVTFYAGAAGVGIAPYYGAITGFVQSATSSLVRHAASPTPGSTVDGVYRTSGETPTAQATAVGTSTPTATATPTQHQLLVNKVKKLAARAVPPHRRINILVLGSDTDAKFDPNVTPPTQVDIVLSLDPISHTIVMFSIPRDSWVHIPNYAYNVGPDGSHGWNKIQIASGVGSGLVNTVCTVESDFGIPIDYWVWVGLAGFTKVVDSIDGITLDVTHPVVDNSYPDDSKPNDPFAYRRLYIPPGPQHINGDAALHFVRSRHGDVKSDFGRSERQQILLSQLRRMLLAKDGADLAALAPTLLNDMQGKVKTSFPLTDLPTVARFLSLLRSEAHDKITNVVLSSPYSTEYSQPDTDPAVAQWSAVPGQPFQQAAVGLNWPLVNQEIVSLFGGQDFSAPHCSQ